MSAQERDGAVARWSAETTGHEGAGTVDAALGDAAVTPSLESEAIAALAEARAAWATSDKGGNVRYGTAVGLGVVLMLLACVPLFVLRALTPESAAPNSPSYLALDAYAKVASGAEVSIGPDQQAVLDTATRFDRADGSYTLTIVGEGCWVVEIGGSYEPPISC